MRVLTFFAVFFTALGSMSIASAQDVTPKKTWESDTPSAVKPLNLKSILRGNKQSRSSSTTNRKRKSGPISRNPITVLKEGGELEYSEALLSTADYNDARAKLRLRKKHVGISSEEAALIIAESKLDEQERLDKLRAKRAEFYMKRGVSDKHTREFFKTANGRLARKKIRNDMRKKIRDEKSKLELVEMKEKERGEVIKRIEREGEESKRKSRVIVPTAQPSSDGTIKPFFYR